jgi:dTDP-4-amino-4,6-dideoxygalactose transaminase
MSVEQIKASINPNTRAVIVAYLYGITWSLYKVKNLCRERNIILIEDAAAAFGSKYNGQLVGKTGDVTVFSFGKGKTLSSGRGGLLIINDCDLSKKIETVIKRLPLSSSIKSFIIAIGEKIIRQPCFYLPAYNMQKIMKGGEFWEKGNINNKKNTQYLNLMDNFTLKLLNKQLKIWESHIYRRIKIANAYRRNIKNPILTHINVSKESEPAYSSYPLIVTEARKEFHKYMQSKGVDLGWSFNYSAAELCGQDNCINAKKISAQILTLPTYPHLSDQQVDYIVSEINKFKIKEKYDAR